MDDDIEYLPDEGEPDASGVLRRMRGRSDAELANIASVLVAAAGAILLLATCWNVVRFQQRIGADFFIGSGDVGDAGPSLVDRLDGLTQSLFGLGEAAILFALAIGLRALTGVLDRQPDA